MNEALVRAGLPDNLLCGVAEPTIESAQALMGHEGVRLLAVTGGTGVVRQAMGSGARRQASCVSGEGSSAIDRPRRPKGLPGAEGGWLRAGGGREGMANLCEAGRRVERRGGRWKLSMIWI